MNVKSVVRKAHPTTNDRDERMVMPNALEDWSYGRKKKHWNDEEVAGSFELGALRSIC